MTLRTAPMTVSLIAGVVAACAVLALLFGAPTVSHAQDGEASKQTPADDAAQDDSAKQLEQVLEGLGVAPSGDADDEAQVEAETSSLLDRFTTRFNDTSDAVSETPGLPTSAEDTPPSHIEPAASDEELAATEPTPTPDDAATEISAAPAAEGNMDLPSDHIGIDQPTAATTDTPVLTLDALLQQAQTSAHLQHEAFYTRLSERRRLAVALRTTLEAAQQVAGYGQAGAQLLQDAPLDTVVATMIADQARKREAEAQSVVAPASLAPPRPIPETPATNEATGFDAWRPVYVVKDARGHRVGWRHRTNGKRVAAYVGEAVTFDDDVVAIVGVSGDANGQTLILRINDVPRDVHL